MFKKQYITGAFLAVISLFSSCTNLDEEIFSSIPEKDFIKLNLNSWQPWFPYIPVCVP